jgi:hypothetical protein
LSSTTSTPFGLYFGRIFVFLLGTKQKLPQLALGRATFIERPSLLLFFAREQIVRELGTV